MASGPETPGLACLMFSIPKRLPHPRPSLGTPSSGAEEKGKQFSQLEGGGLAGLREVAKTTGLPALSRGERDPGMMRSSMRI